MDNCVICHHTIYEGEEIAIIGNNQGEKYECHADCAETWMQAGRIKLKEKIELFDFTDESNDLSQPSYDLSEDIYESTASLLQNKIKTSGLTRSQIDVKFKEINIKSADDQTTLSYDYSEDTTTDTNIETPLFEKKKNKHKYFKYHIIIGILSCIVIIFSIWIITCFSLKSFHNITFCPSNY
jgi:hypothetical protein